MLTLLDAMCAKWTEYRNVYSPDLEVVWSEIFTTLDHQSGPDASAIWPVIPAELGIGKTTSAKVWCSMLSVGKSALVVVRSREQADEFARDVNSWSREERRAVALYSPDEKLPNPYWRRPEKTRGFPVVVVCHKSYELGLDEFSLAAAQARFDTVHQYLDRRRDIVIIDEALDQVAEARIERGIMPELLRLLRPVQHDHREAMRVLESAQRVLREAPLDRHQAVTGAELLAVVPTYSIADATAYLDELWTAVRKSKRIRPEPRAIISETLTALRRHLHTKPWSNRAAVSSARLLRTPEGTRGVILDATGSLNNVYLGRPDEFAVRQLRPVRNYSNVTIREARTKWTGKLKARDHADEIASDVIGALLAHYGDQARERRVLVVVSKDKPTIVAFERAARDQFAQFAVTNWGRVDGRNDWKDFDTIVIGTLHYGSSTQDVNTYLAIADVAPDDASLNAVDEVKSIRQRRIAASVAQAIGRIQLRTMTSPDGRCEPCDVFIRLPNSAIIVDADKVLEGVVQVLPGVVVTRWERASRKLVRAAKRTGAKYDDAFVALVAALPGGVHDVRDDIRERLGIKNDATWHRMTKAARMAGTPIFQKMRAIGATFEERPTATGVSLMVVVDQATAVAMPEPAPVLPKFRGQVPRAWNRIVKAADAMPGGERLALTDYHLGDSRSRRYQTLVDLRGGRLVEMLATRNVSVADDGRTLVKP